MVIALQDKKKGRKASEDMSYIGSYLRWAGLWVSLRAGEWEQLLAWLRVWW